MKKYIIILSLNLITLNIISQTIDTLDIKNDTNVIITPNPFLKYHKSYETINNSFITGSSFSFIRSQDNPLITIDEIPVNPIYRNNMHYTEFLGSPHLLSYDIRNVEIMTITNKDKIVSGVYNNSIGLHTKDIQLGKQEAVYEINNFTSFEFITPDTLGYSVVSNFNGQKSNNKIGYRFSLSNGYQNDYITNNGLKRYSGNLKIKYMPHRNVVLTGFIDYSNFTDFNRDQASKFKSNRLFSYVNANAKIFGLGIIIWKVCN